MEKRGSRAVAAFRGAVVGAVNGLLGGGGGMLAVPLLGRSMPSRKAHATAIALILPASALSGAMYLRLGIPFGVLLPAAIGVCAGGALGAKLLGILPSRITEPLFAALMLAAGVRMLFP